MFFFTREKKNWTRENFQYSAREVFKLAEKKILKTAREKKLCPRKKQQNSTREKKIFAREKKSKFPPSKFKKYLEILKFLPEKKKINPRKNLKICPRKLQTAQDCPRKILKKVGEKKISAREKNQKKYQKTFSRALLIFSGKKINTGADGQYIYYS